MKTFWNKLHTTLKIGIIMLFVGSGPLLVFIGLDSLGVIDVGNAVGPGLLAMITFYPSLILIIIGVVITLRKRKKEKQFTYTI